MANMNIAVDARVLLRPISGVYVYLWQIIKAISNINSNIHFLLCLDRDETYLPKEIRKACNGTVKFVNLPFSSLKPGHNFAAPLWLHFLLPAHLSKTKADLFWGPNHLLPGRLLSIPQVVTVHDLGPYQKYDFQKPLWKMMFKTFFPLSLKTAKSVIADSTFIGEEIIAKFPYTKNKIHIVNPGLRPLEKKVGKNEIATQAPFYILAVGNLTLRKNYETLIEAYHILKLRGLPHKLVICGKQGWGAEKVYLKINSLNLNNSIVVNENADDLLLDKLYLNASLFVMPSYYEGFGLPLLEAMSFGLPCIVSNTGALPEVIDDAGVTIPPDDVDLWASSMERLLSDQLLAKTLSKKAIERSRQFSWEKTAKETISVFESVI
ncbi:MAG: glycosyltransferase family 1 protein [Candidatus Edwardsbacteria bacterium]